MTKSKFNIGDRVRYSSQFCRQIGAVSGFTPQARGVITGFWGYKNEMVHIHWDFSGPDGTRQGAANIFNLQKIK